MRFRYLLIVMVSALVASCKKETGAIPNPPLPEQQVLLKDIVVPNLPSPYYHFEYDTTGKVSLASFASDYYRYSVEYANGRISQLMNITLATQDRLEYLYNYDGEVNVVKYVNSSGVTYERVVLDYDGKKLINLERQKKDSTHFITDKILSFTYYPDGNLEELTYHYLPIPGQAESIYTDRFEQYDDKVNVDGFGLIHNEFFDHLILLPGVQLQKNNPGKETRTGDAENYEVEYTYTYSDKNLPLTKKGNLLFLTGSNTGKRFETNLFYSYY